ncbi:MAG: efflux RND transporter periplasmic adaptor subunit [Alphaproteobacteria bacterium]|nr:efflux RND transporter periplasmic adaptor subunit [Alphaproteobacteria bacterium]
MNIRFASAFEGLPARVQRVPLRFAELDRRTRWFVIGGAVTMILAILWYAFGFGTGGHKSVAVPVVVAVAQTKDVTVTEPAIGTVVAQATVQVTAQVAGQLLQADFHEGDLVRKGQLLFEIDPRPFQAALAQAQGQLAKDSAQLVSAQNDERRYNTLFAQNAVSPQQRDQTEATAKSLAGSVAADRAALQVASINLGYTKIYSPIDGKTGPILIQPGNLVGANGASPLVSITQIEPVKVSFALPQSDLPRIQERARAGQLTARLNPEQTGGRPLEAPVDFVSNQVNAQAGTIELRATFDNRDHRLVPGQMVDVDVTLATLKKATVVPREAVNDGPVGRYVFVIGRDGTAMMKAVSVKFDDGKNMAVTGIGGGAKVVTDGQLRVVPGATVSIVNAARRDREASTPR